jgi:hypothetical protein
MAKNTAPPPPIQPNEVYLAEAIALHCDALIDFSEKYAHKLQQQGIAKALDMLTTRLSEARRKDEPKTNFGNGKTRKEILNDIRAHYAADIAQIEQSGIKLYPATPMASYFRFKQYFMAGTGAVPSDGVEAAQLDLFYVKENSVIRYNEYELTIKAAANFEEIILKGAIQCFGKDTLLLIGGEGEYHTTTLIHIPNTIAPSDEVYYHGFYLTYTPIGEKIAAPVILEFVKNEATFGCNDVSPAIKALLNKTRRDIAAPVPIQSITKKT